MKPLRAEEEVMLVAPDTITVFTTFKTVGLEALVLMIYVNVMVAITPKENVMMSTTP